MRIIENSELKMVSGGMGPDAWSGNYMPIVISNVNIVPTLLGNPISFSPIDLDVGRIAAAIAESMKDWVYRT